MIKTMLTPAQKRYLKGLANPIGKRYLLGKSEPDEGFYEVIDKALEAHELIKVGLNQNATMKAKDIAPIIAEKVGAELVQVIGRVIVLYRESQKNKKIILK